MYETFMNTVRRLFTPEGLFGDAGRFLGADVMKKALLVALPMVVIGFVLWAVPAFRGWFRRMQARGGWRGILTAVPAGVFKLLVLFMLVRLLVVAMAYQGEVFENEHGRVTETNRSAVLTKWGGPHEQRELAVSFTRKRIRVTRQLKLPGKDGRIVKESFWKDEERPIEAVEGQMPTLISTREDEEQIAVIQKAIRSADVDITVVNNPRTLGNANYAGYEDRWHMTYVVANEQDVPVTAHMEFHPPDDVNRLQITAAGDDMLARASSTGDGGQTWKLDLDPGKETKVDIQYESRGLEHLRYIPRRQIPTAHYRVTMTVEGIPAKELDWPIGSSPPDERIDDLSGTSHTLHWSLDNAVTRKDIGLKLPKAKQPQYHITRLLAQAPLGLLLLVALLILPRLIAARAVSVPVVAVLMVAYYLFYTFMGRLTDLGLEFPVAFLVSALVLAGLAVYFRFRDRSGLFLPVQDVAGFVVLMVLYPLAAIHGQTAFWMQVLYITMLLYACVLMIRFLVLTPPPGAAAPGEG